MLRAKCSTAFQSGKAAVQKTAQAALQKASKSAEMDSYLSLSIDLLSLMSKVRVFLLLFAMRVSPVGGWVGQARVTHPE